MHRFRDLAIARKLVISMMLTTGLALGLATAGFTTHQIAEFRRSMNARVTSLADSLGANGAGALAFQDEDAAGRIVGSVEGQAYIVIACLYVPEGPLLAEYRRDAEVACPVDAETFAAIGDDPLWHLSVIDYEGDPVGFVGLVADREELWANLRDYALTAAGLLFAALGAAWALAFFLQFLIAEPLLHLVSVARTVTERRDYSMRAVPTSRDEVGLLGSTFNDMLDQLETDAEDRKKATHNLKAARDRAEAASRAKSSFLATMSHEIRTPMNGITGMTTLLLNSPLNPGQRECVEVVQRSTDSLLQIINDILAISKQLVELMGGTIGVDDAPGGGARFLFAVPLKLDPNADETGTATNLDHLRVLALSAKPRNRTVLLGQLGPLLAAVDVAATTDEALAMLKAAAVRQVPYHVLVADDGEHSDGETLAAQAKTDPGLASTVLVALTSAVDSEAALRFRRAGFSAYLVKPVTASTLLDAISVAWEAGAVSSDGEMVTKSSLAGHREPVGGRLGVKTPAAYRVLVAEDNGVNQLVATKLLEYLGGRVDIAPNGRDAVRMAGSEAYDLVLMDCQMPELDGYEATAEIRRLEGESSRVPIIAMTANAMSGDRERCLAAGMDDYVTKPIKLSCLSGVLERWLHTEAAVVPATDVVTGSDVRV